jgi:hypothetical protein
MPMMKNVIEAVHIPDIMRLVKPATPSDDHQPPPRRRRQRHQSRNDVPNPKVYAPDGHLNAEVEEPEVPHIDLVG